MSNKFAILIGINDYSQYPLDYCVNDINKIEEALNKNCGFNKNNIRTIISSFESSKSNIKELLLKSLETISSDFIKNEDGFFFFFSGHGVYKDEPFLLFHEELIKISEIYKLVNDKLKPKNQFFVFDACYSGEKIKSISDQAFINELYSQKLSSKSVNRTIIAATRHDQTATEKKKYQNGTLTYYFIKALLQKDLYNENGFITPTNIADYVRREISLINNFEQIPYTYSEDSGSYPFAYVKNIENGVKLFPYNIEDKNSSILKKKLIVREAPTVLFYERLTKAFPGVRGLEWYHGRDAVDGLVRFFKKPFYFDEAQGYGTFTDPIWWFRGTSALSIRKFKKLGDEKLMINNDELIVDKVAVFNPTSYFSSFIYIQSKPDKPSGLYEIDQTRIKQHINSIGYSFESVGLYKDLLIKQAEYEDGAAIIDGQYVELENTELRNRYLSKYNIILVPKSSPHNTQAGNLLGEKYMNSILKNEKSVEKFAKEYQLLPRSYLDQ